MYTCVLHRTEVVLQFLAPKWRREAPSRLFFRSLSRTVDDWVELLVNVFAGLLEIFSLMIRTSSRGANKTAQPPDFDDSDHHRGGVYRHWLRCLRTKNKTQPPPPSRIGVAERPHSPPGPRGTCNDSAMISRDRSTIRWATT